MLLNGIKVKVEDNRGAFIFTNVTEDKIKLSGEGSVEMTIDQLEEIYTLMKKFTKKASE